MVAEGGTGVAERRKFGAAGCADGVAERCGVGSGSGETACTLGMAERIPGMAARTLGVAEQTLVDVAIRLLEA